MLNVSTWDTVCLRFIPRDYPLSPDQRNSAQRLLRHKAWSLSELMATWLLPEALFGSAAGMALIFLDFHWVIALTAVLLIGAVLWVMFAIHMRARAESHLCDVLLGFGLVICPGCYYWLGQDTQQPQSCPECGLQARLTEHAP